MCIVMDMKEYLVLSEKTLSQHFDIKDEKEQKMFHAVIGLSTEANELLDQFKKHVFYKRELDLVNLKEELGDVMWYIAILLRELDVKFEDVLDWNIEKLKKRYGEKFDTQKSIDRNIENELNHIK